MTSGSSTGWLEPTVADATKPPTCRELLVQLEDEGHRWSSGGALAARVEKVLAYIDVDQSPSEERQFLIRAIRRILNGEET